MLRTQTNHSPYISVFKLVALCYTLAILAMQGTALGSDSDSVAQPLPPIDNSRRLQIRLASDSASLIPDSVDEGTTPLPPVTPLPQVRSESPSGQPPFNAQVAKSPPPTAIAHWLWDQPHPSQQTTNIFGQALFPQEVPPPRNPEAIPPVQRSVYESPWDRKTFRSLFDNVPDHPPLYWYHLQPSLVPSPPPDSPPQVHQWNSNESEICSSPSSSAALFVPYQASDFRGTAAPAQTYQPQTDISTYYGRYFVPTQRPWVEWWRPFYTGGIYDPQKTIFSDVNPLSPHFLVYGDYRAAVGVHRVGGKPVRSLANRLNLDFDLRLTGTERIHAFMGPLDHNNRFTRLDFSDSSDVRFVREMDAQLETFFFEGDLGAMTGGLTGIDAPFDLPFTFGRIPLLYQNGIWMEDAITGVALGFPWRHSRSLEWSNYDVSFFAGFNQVTSPAFNNDNHAAQVFGTAWFIEAYEGYIEADYAFLDDQQGLNRSYHNAAIAYTRRYFTRISNSIRLIGNSGQDGPRVGRSADGLLLLVENSLISFSPSNVVPYYNGFLGYGSPQSVARAAGAGGILRNTGINFESDNLTGYPTLDNSGSNAYGGAIGMNLLSADFRQNLAFEFAALDTYGDDRLSKAAGAQYAIGTRWQRALNNWTLLRVDLINGWLDNAPDIYGTRCELRWKF